MPIYTKRIINAEAVYDVIGEQRPRRARNARPREQVGTFLKSRIESLIQIKTGKGCGCTNLANQMDSWGIAGCEQRRDEIVGHLVGNREILIESLSSQGWLIGWVAGLVPDAVIRRGAEWLLDTAIEDARKQSKPVRVARPKRTVSAGVVTSRTPITQIQPRPFTERPRLTLLCHCWANGDNWRRHVEYLKPVEGVFHRKIMGVAVNSGSAAFDDVCRAFGDSWEYIHVQNDKKLREVATYRQMFEMVQSVDENDVTFCIHTKGTQDRTAASQQVQWWTEAMYETVLYNWKNVLRKLEEGYSIAGSFRRNGGHFQTRYSWHYSGTFFAFRNAAAFVNGVPKIQQKWWGTESWPGSHFSTAEAACMFADNAGYIYKEDPQLEQALIEWRQLNAVVSS